MPATKDFTTNDLSILRIGPFSPAKRTAHCLSQLWTVSTLLARLSQIAANHSTHHKTAVKMATCVFNDGPRWAQARHLHRVRQVSERESTFHESLSSRYLRTFAPASAVRARTLAGGGGGS